VLPLRGSDFGRAVPASDAGLISNRGAIRRVEARKEFSSRTHVQLSSSRASRAASRGTLGIEPGTRCRAVVFRTRAPEGRHLLCSARRGTISGTRSKQTRGIYGIPYRGWTKSTFVHALAAPAVMSTWHRNPSSSQRSCTHSDPPRVQGEGTRQRAQRRELHSHDHAIIHSCSSPTAWGSVLESTLATAVSRGRRFRPPDRRRGRSLA